MIKPKEEKYGFNPKQKIYVKPLDKTFLSWSQFVSEAEKSKRISEEKIVDWLEHGAIVRAPEAQEVALSPDVKKNILFEVEYKNKKLTQSLKIAKNNGWITRIPCSTTIQRREITPLDFSDQDNTLEAQPGPIYLLRYKDKKLIIQITEDD